MLLFQVGGDEQLVTDRRGTSVEQLVSAIKFPSVSEDDKVRVLNFLAAQAFLAVDKDKVRIRPLSVLGLHATGYVLWAVSH